MKSLKTTLCVAVLALSAANALWAQARAPAVRVDGAWARASVQGQTGTGAFMALTARDNLKLVAVASPAAGVAEVHEMKVEGDVMRMRAIDALDLPAGKTVELRPGGYHVMLLDLKAPLKKDTVIPLTLVFRDAKGAESRMELQLPVSARAPAPMDGRK
ncbi:MAG: copper chaperone PCu(A)C [Ramlibacter sp.]